MTLVAPNFGVGAVYGNPFAQFLPHATHASVGGAPSRKRKADADLDETSAKRSETQSASDSNRPPVLLSAARGRKRKAEASMSGTSVDERSDRLRLSLGHKRKSDDSDTDGLDKERARQESWRDFGKPRVSRVKTEAMSDAFRPAVQQTPPDQTQPSFAELNRRFELDMRRRQVWSHFDPRAATSQAMSIDSDASSVVSSQARQPLAFAHSTETVRRSWENFSRPMSLSMPMD